ncbi:tetratricopeptide repeat protein [Paenibacillus sp. CMAA1364]
MGYACKEYCEKRKRGIDVLNNVITQSRRALAYLRSDNLPVRTASAWMLGVSCQQRGDYAEACKAYNEVITNCQSLGHQLMAVMAVIGTAQIREAEGRHDLVAEHYREALRLAGNALPHPAITEAQLGLERICHILDNGTKGNCIEPLSQQDFLYEEQWMNPIAYILVIPIGGRWMGTKCFLLVKA